MTSDEHDLVPLILFVDDEPNVLAAMRRTMHTHRSLYRGIYVTSAREALSVVEAEPVDAIVTDIIMPELDGFQLIALLRAGVTTSDIPVVVVTGSGECGLRTRALKEGAADLLGKPVDEAELRARLDSVLRMRVYQQRVQQQGQALEELLSKRTDELLLARLEMLWKLSLAAELRDDNTGQHIARVGCYSRVIADALGLPAQFVEMIAVTAPLHDMGKIGIPDSILLKPSELTEAERLVMETHCLIGARMLGGDDGAREMYRFATNRIVDGEPSPLIEKSLDMAVSIALCHHERWNGSGYPAALAGTDIPLAARIVAVADVFDALCSARPYKAAIAPDAAAAVIAQRAGIYFDRQVVDAFVHSLPSLRAILGSFPDKSCRALDEAA